MQAAMFCFASEFFQLNLISEINGLLTENTFADVTLVSDDQIMIPAHRFVLVLKNILVNNPHSHPLLYLRGVKKQELRYKKLRPKLRKISGKAPANSIY